MLQSFRHGNSSFRVLFKQRVHQIPEILANFTAFRELWKIAKHVKVSLALFDLLLSQAFVLVEKPEFFSCYHEVEDCAD
jgi:hypothetical protein